MVVVSGMRADVLTAIFTCVTVLHTASSQPDQSAFEDAACWGYHPPNDQVPSKQGHQHCSKLCWDRSDAQATQAQAAANDTDMWPLG